MGFDRRNFLQFAGLTGLTLTAAACGAKSTAANSAASGPAVSLAPKTPKVIDLKGAPVVGLFTSLNNDYYASWDMGARRAVEAFGGEYRAFTNEGDAARQISQFEQQVQAGAKIFFMTAPDPANVPTIARIAQQNKVFLTNTWEMVPWTTPFDYGDSYVTYFTTDTVNLAYGVAKKLFEKMGGKGNLVHLTGHPGSTPDSQRTIGVDKALKEFPDIKLLARQPGEWNRDDARNAMAGIITKYGHEINGVFGQNDDVAIGAMNALNEQGIQGVPITGFDGNKGTMDFIKSGAIYGAYSTLPFWAAGFSAVRAIDASLGVKFDPLDRQLFTSGVFVTKDNVDAYLSTFFGNEDVFDWQLMSRAAHPNDWDPQNTVWPLDVEAMWDFANKPAGWAAPAAYVQAKPNVQALTDEYKSHWKRHLI
ncbi:sugar ABC transporter substrate-binding protein [Arthrobacter sp. KNU-44]|uniref:sugar ABC transporter substrate-binding protein n=1 Tax=Arthrobacter sp. KNU-44 TaxID=3450744 RepID=UPI003F42D899